MHIHLLYFGVLKELSGKEREVVEVAEGSSVQDVLEVLRGRVHESPAVWGSMAVAVNREYAGKATELHDGDEVALLPPVSGGAR